MTTRLIAYDPVLKRPGCVILAAALGADVNACHLFDSRDWLVHLTDDLRVFATTDEQLARLVTITKEAHDPVIEMPCEFHAFTGKTRDEREAEWAERAVKLVQEQFPGAELITEEAA